MVNTKKNLSKFILLIVSALIMICSIGGIFGNIKAHAAEEISNDFIYRTAQQIAVTASSEPQTKLYITFTTIDQSIENAKVTINEKGKISTTEFKDDAVERNVRSVSNSTINIEGSGSKVAQKVFFTVTLTGLNAKTNYECICYTSDGTDEYESVKHEFWTAANKNDPEEFRFVYMTDPQSSGSNGRAITSTTQFIKSENPDAKFLYIAGDLTDTAANEGQWEAFFNAPGNSEYRNTNAMDKTWGNRKIFSESQMSNFTLVATQGNHDNNDLAFHLKHDSLVTGADTDKVVYSFDYGNIKFIILNFETGHNKDSQIAVYNRQKTFFEQKAAEAKAAGQRIAVCIHKGMYEGGSHLTDGDARNARMAWAKVFEDANVDFVLQGHDHILSRGQVRGGYNASPHTQIGDRMFADVKAQNAPLYYVANCASTLKFYDYASAAYANGEYATEEDPLAYNYEFLDITSIMQPGSKLNPFGPRTSDTNMSSGDPRYPTFVEVTVGKDYTRFDAKMYSCKTDGTVVGGVFLFDSYTLYKKDAIENVKNKIASIGSFSSNRNADVDATLLARNAYNALNETQKLFVVNYSSLLAAEAKLIANDLKGADGKDATNNANVSLSDSETDNSATIAIVVSAAAIVIAGAAIFFVLYKSRIKKSNYLS
ncbi:MAG: metallophosphoesterase [Firmicutes bacterium]|nr:metallophosphoesterase [Bacillota bacterium]